MTAATQDVLDRSDADLRSRAKSQTTVRKELLVQLVRKDLKVKYQNSTLGFAWSLANPLFLMVVYYFVFSVVLGSGIKYFPIYLMSGMLLFNFFQTGVLGGAGSVLGNAGLVKKVRFPLAVLPFSAVGFALVHYVLQLSVLVVVMAAIGYDFIGWNLLLAIPTLMVCVLFTTALAMLFGALNVRYRDTYHLLELVMIAWFWLTPSIYGNGLVGALLKERGISPRVYYLDPMAAIVASMQRALYNRSDLIGTSKKGTEEFTLITMHYAFYLEMLGIAAVVSVVMMYVGRRVFRNMSADFAEEL